LAARLDARLAEIGGDWPRLAEPLLTVGRAVTVGRAQSIIGHGAGRWSGLTCNEGGNQHAMREAISMQSGRQSACNQGGNQHAIREAISML
jgi:hypothetical protein